ncbi:oxygen-independent coproporphyrinogen III oxidase [Lacinutrix salivirga]
MCNSLIDKYNVAGPRYTSYPTVPYWDNQSFSLKQWKASISKSFNISNATEGISIYIHLPFCESLCTFCGCNKRITKRHEVERPYINALLKEWYLYCDLLENRPKIKELHIGGGTPTFFSSTNLEILIKGLLTQATLAKDYEFSFEGHPNNTTKEHLETLYDLGFKRVSFGVQDYNETVQKAIHRIQPFNKVETVTRLAREIGYTSVSHDIIFGLPFQTEAHVEHTINLTKQLLPDRIAFYSYAHVPWLKGNGQRGYDETNLPSGKSKRAQYELGKKMLFEAGYVEIGMDHFALKTDTLYKATTTKKLHRNFMGYTASKTKAMIGLGVSSISDSWFGFAQNVKNIEDYYNVLKDDIIPVQKGHILTTEDLIIRQHILNLMCHFETTWTPTKNYFKELPEVLEKLKEMETDALIKITPNQIIVTEKGKPFVRNVCMAFDLLLQRKKPQTRLFSMTI